MSVRRNDKAPYVVFMGNVGTGKSTLIGKLADVRGQSSDASESFTRESKLFWSKNGNLLINDTPGANSMADKLEHNMQIAAAFSYRPVSKIFIVVKADTRMDTTVDNVRKYAEQFSDLDPDLLGTIVTHMDQVLWDNGKFLPAISDELGMTDVIYSSQNESGCSLERNIRQMCKGPGADISVDGEEFFKLFKINNNNLKIVRSAKKQVDLFRAIKRSFDQQRPSIPKQFEADLLFEFQAFMTDMITEAQKRLSEENGFTFCGDGASNEVGHVANMTNQLRAILYDIRIETLEQAAKDHGVDDIRRCPHCNMMWALIAGCEEDTTCGELVNEVDAKHTGVMATFNFVADIQDGLRSFSISRSGEKQVHRATQRMSNVGCGRTIAWKNMRRVTSSELPPGFRQSVEVSTKDISMAGLGRVRNVTKRVGDSISQTVSNMQFGN